MKFLILGLDRMAPDALLGDDRLTRVRYLMEAGVYGRLAGVSRSGPTEIHLALARAGLRTTAVRWSGGVRGTLRGADWDVLLAMGDGPGDGLALDEELDALLGLLPEETAVLLVSALGAFVLAGPGVPSLDEVEGARAIDLAPTLLALAGLDPPAALPGRPLITPADGETPPPTYDVDPAVLERLSGLGYM